VPKDVNRKVDIEEHRRALLSKYSAEITQPTPEARTGASSQGRLGFVVKRIMLRVWFLR
jgi:hypothetical protein